MADDIQVLTTVQRLVRLDRADEALAPLLQLWAASYAERLVPVIEAVSQRAAVGRTPVGDADSRQAAWLARSQDCELADLSILLPDLTKTTVPNARKRLAMFKEWPPDPRLSRQLLSHLKQPPWSTSPKRQLYLCDAIRILVAQGDPVGNAWIHTADKAHQGPRKPLGKTTGAALSVAAQRPIKPSTPLSAQGIKLGRSIIEGLKGQSGQSDQVTGEMLLAAVHAHPGADEPRLVYADWLSGRGDPQGLFINLQLVAESGTLSTTERTLIKQWGRHWLGPLASCLKIKSVIWRRGFPVAGTFRRNAEVIASEVVGHPLWSTFEAIDFSHIWDYEPVHSILIDPVAANLREVRGVRWRSLQALAETDEATSKIKPLKWTTLGSFLDTSGAVATRLIKRLAVPYLVELDWSGVTRISARDIERVLNFRPGIRRLRIGGGGLSMLVPFLKQLDQIDLQLIEPIGRPCWWIYRLERGEGGPRLTAIQGPNCDHKGSAVDALLEMLETVEPGTIDNFEFRWGRRPPSTNEWRARTVRAALRRAGISYGEVRVPC